VLNLFDATSKIPTVAIYVSVDFSNTDLASYLTFMHVHNISPLQIPHI
jgi:hypothetical protein